MKVVAIGGGTGLSTVLRGLKHYLRGIAYPSGRRGQDFQTDRRRHRY